MIHRLLVIELILEIQRRMVKPILVMNHLAEGPMAKVQRATMKLALAVNRWIMFRPEYF